MHKAERASEISFYGEYHERTGSDLLILFTFSLSCGSDLKSGADDGTALECLKFTAKKTFRFRRLFGFCRPCLQPLSVSLSWSWTFYEFLRTVFSLAYLLSPFDSLFQQYACQTCVLATILWEDLKVNRPIQKDESGFKVFKFESGKVGVGRSGHLSSCSVTTQTE